MIRFFFFNQVEQLLGCKVSNESGSEAVMRLQLEVSEGQLEGMKRDMKKLVSGSSKSERDQSGRERQNAATYHFLEIKRNVFLFTCCQDLKIHSPALGSPYGLACLACCCCLTIYTSQKLCLIMLRNI